MMQIAGVLRQRRVALAEWPLDVQKFHLKWCEYKVEGGLMDFTDLIEISLESVDAIDGCAVLFVDEAQDMSRLEFALARKWGAAADQLVVVGDPDQNLYEWRGSDPGAFYATEAHSTHVLSQSYRVPAAVHRVATQWIDKVPGRIPVEYHPTDQPGEVRVGTGLRYRKAEAFVEELERKLDETNDETIMVLTSCTYMLGPILARLRAEGVPFHNPYRTRQGAWNPLRAAGRLLAYKRPDSTVWGDEARMWTWDDLRRWGEVLQAEPVFSRGFKTIIKARCTDDRFGDSDANTPIELDRLLTNLSTDEVRERVVDLDLDWWESMLRHNDRKTQVFPLRVARRHGAGVLREQPRLIVGTIHSVKGGEADHVYLFPDLSPVAYNAWEKGVRAAIRRQFYVGMTRARTSLTLCDQSGKVDSAVTW